MPFPRKLASYPLTDYFHANPIFLWSWLMWVVESVHYNVLLPWDLKIPVYLEAHVQEIATGSKVL